MYDRAVRQIRAAFLNVGVILVTVAHLSAADDQRHLDRYNALLAAAQADVSKGLPKIDEQNVIALQKARDAVKVAEAQAKAAQQALGTVQTAKALVDHAKGKWIGGAEKGIAQAEAAIKNAKSNAERDAAQKELAKWQANKEDGLKALKERQAALDKAKVDEPKLVAANQAAQKTLVAARANELTASKLLLSAAEPLLASDKLDAKGKQANGKPMPGGSAQVELIAPPQMDFFS